MAGRTDAFKSREKIWFVFNIFFAKHEGRGGFFCRINVSLEYFQSCKASFLWSKEFLVNREALKSLSSQKKSFPFWDYSFRLECSCCQSSRRFVSKAGSIVMRLSRQYLCFQLKLEQFPLQNQFTNFFSKSDFDDTTHIRLWNSSSVENWYTETAMWYHYC